MSIVLDTPFEIVLNTDNSFSPAEVQYILDTFVCAICHAELMEVQPPSSPRRLIVCLEHGNVCDVGRVTRATVSIEIERAYKSFHEVVRNLPDLWGKYAEEGFPYDKAVKLRKDYVCAVCGGPIVLLNHPDPEMVHLACQSHGNINLCGYTPRNEFKYDFQRIRAWEQEHKRR